MLNYPKTIKEARKHKYSASSRGFLKAPYHEGCCAYEMSEPLTLHKLSRQCLKNNGYGPTSLYCKQHAEIVGGGQC